MSCGCASGTWLAGTLRQRAAAARLRRMGQPGAALLRLRDVRCGRSVRTWRSPRWGCVPWHGSRYRRDGSPGGAALPGSWWQRYEQLGEPVPVGYGDQAAFGRWCAAVSAQPWPGQVNLRGLRPLVRAEIQWGLFVHTQRARPTRWDLGWIRSLVMTCRTLEVNSLVDFEFGAGGSAAFTGAIAKEILHELRLVYFTPAQAKDAGFLETEHFGVLFPHRMSHVDLTGIPQRWLRDLTWDYIADLLRSPRCPRTASPIDGYPPGGRRAGRLPGAGGARRRPRSRRAAPRAHGAVRRRPAPPRTRGPAVAGDQAARRGRGHRHHDHPVAGVQRRPQAAARCAGDRRCRAAGAGPGVHHRDPAPPAPHRAGPRGGRSPTRSPAPWPTRPTWPTSPPPTTSMTAALRDIWETTVITGRRIGEVIKLRLGLHRPLRRAGDVLARPDQGRQLRRRDPHPRTALRPARRTAAQDPGPLHRPLRLPARRRSSAPNWRCSPRSTAARTAPCR